MRVTAILVTYNSATTIESCLKSLQMALRDQNGETIILDNNSTDDTRTLLQRLSSTEKILYLPYNIGFATAVNKGFSIAKGQYILLVNPDLIIDWDCIKGMFNFLVMHSEAGAVGPKLVYPNGDYQPSCRRYPTVRAIISSQIRCTTKLMGTMPLSHYLMEDMTLTSPTEVEWIIGACMMIKRDAVKDVGSFDKHFFLYREDTDWCYRARNRGWKIYYLPHLKAVHHYRRESARRFNKAFFWHIKSILRFYRKHGMQL